MVQNRDLGPSEQLCLFPDELRTIRRPQGASQRPVKCLAGTAKSTSPRRTATSKTLYRAYRTRPFEAGTFAFHSCSTGEAAYSHA